VLIAALAVGASPGAAAKKRGPASKVSFVEGELVAPASGTATYTGQCPGSRPHPVGGEFGILNGGTRGQLALAASYPQGRRGWFVAVKNLTDQPQGFFAGVVCVAARAVFTYPRTTTVVQAAYGAFASRCPRRAPHAIDSYFGPQSAADLGKVVRSFNGPSIQGKVQYGVGGVRNTGTDPIALFGGAICTSLPTTLDGGPSNAPLAPDKEDGYSTRCSTRFPTPIGGFAYPLKDADRGLLMITNTYGTGKFWDIGARNFGDRAVTFETGVVCAG
jgi:hypothetical protein